MLRFKGYFVTLADPDSIGVSGGAAIGAVAMIVLGDALNLPPVILTYGVLLQRSSPHLL